MMIVTKKDGATLAGAPEAEAADSITILQPDGKEIVVSKADIGSQTLAISVMPPMGQNPQACRTPRPRGAFRNAPVIGPF